VALAACEHFERGPGVSLMMIVMLIAGIGCLLAGLLAIGFGIPVQEFSFGNTLILSGAVTACTGLIILALRVVVAELKNIAQRLGPGLRDGVAFDPELNAPQPAAATAPPRNQAPRSSGLLFNRDQPALEDADDAEVDAQPSAPSPAPWHEEAAARDRTRSEEPPPLPEPAETAPAVKPRRNLLFSSSSRKERERAQTRTADPSEPQSRPAPATAPPVAESSEAPPATFDDAWPKLERSRGVDVQPPRRSGHAPSTFAETTVGADRHPPAARMEDQPPVTVLKSGVVDGMAYSLYSDGSIEAQMPEGMMRFASIDELRSHLDQRP
jgi:hypothetical protein